MFKQSLLFLTFFLNLIVVTRIHGMEVWIFRKGPEKHRYLVPKGLNGFEVGFDLCRKWGLYAPHEQYPFQGYMTRKVARDFYRVILRKKFFSNISRLMQSRRQEGDMYMIDVLSGFELSAVTNYEKLQNLHPAAFSLVEEAYNRLNFIRIVNTNLTRLSNTEKQIFYRNFFQIRTQMDRSN